MLLNLNNLLVSVTCMDDFSYLRLSESCELKKSVFLGIHFENQWLLTFHDFKKSIIVSFRKFKLLLKEDLQILKTLFGKQISYNIV